MYGPIHPVNHRHHHKDVNVAPVKKKHVANHAHRLPKKGAEVNKVPHGAANQRVYKVQKASGEKLHAFAGELLEKQLQYSEEIKKLISQGSPAARKKLAAIGEELNLILRQVEEIDACFARDNRKPAGKQTAEMLSLLLEVTRDNQMTIQLNIAQEFAKELIEESLKQQKRIDALPIAPAYRQLAEEMKRELKAMQEQVEEIRQGMAGTNAPKISQQVLQEILDYNLGRIKEIKKILAEPKLVAVSKVKAAIDKDLSILNDKPLDVIAPEMDVMIHRVMKNLNPVPNPDVEDMPIYQSAWANYVEEYDVPAEEKEPTAADELAKMMAELRHEKLYRHIQPLDGSMEIDSDGDSYMSDSFNLDADADSVMEDSFHLEQNEDHSSIESIAEDEGQRDRLPITNTFLNPASVARARIHRELELIATEVAEIINANEFDALSQLEALEGEIAHLRAEWELQTSYAVRLPSALQDVIFSSQKAIEDFRKRQNAPLDLLGDSSVEMSMDELKRRLAELSLDDLDLDGDSSMGDSFLDDEIDVQDAFENLSDDEQPISNVVHPRFSGQRIYISKEAAGRENIHQQIEQLAIEIAAIMQADDVDALEQLDQLEGEIAQLRVDWERLHQGYGVRLPSALSETISLTLGEIDEFRNRRNNPIDAFEGSDKIVTAEEELAQMMAMLAAGEDGEELDDHFQLSSSEDQY